MIHPTCLMQIYVLRLSLFTLSRSPSFSSVPFFGAYHCTVFCSSCSSFSMNGRYAYTMHLPFVFYLKCRKTKESECGRKKERTPKCNQYFDFNTIYTHTRMHKVHCTFAGVCSYLTWTVSSGRCCFCFRLFGRSFFIFSFSLSLSSFYLSSELCVRMCGCNEIYSNSAEGSDGSRSSCIC